MSVVALSLDTSTSVLSAALVEYGEGVLRVLATRVAGPPLVTSTLVPGVFDELLAEAGLSLPDVSVLISGLGPGLFTGVRVAVSTMKAIAYARSRPLIGAGSLEAMALAATRGDVLRRGDALALTTVPDSGLLCPILDARKGEVYSALYRTVGGRLTVVTPPGASTPRVLADRLIALDVPVRLFGTGTAPMRAVMQPGEMLRVDSAPETPGAAEIALLALSRTPTPAFDAAAVLALEPTYLRPPEAEVARQKRAAAGN